MEISSFCDLNIDILYQREFNSLSGVLNTLYDRLTRENKLKIEKVSKINILFVEKYKSISMSNYPPYDKIIDIDQVFNFKLYDKIDDITEKKKMINDGIIQALKRFTKKNKLDFLIFEKIYHEIIALNYTDKYYHVQKKFSKDKKYYANILVENQGKQTQISTIFYNEANELIKKVILIETFAHEYFYRGLLGRTKWDDNKFTLKSKSGEINFIADLNKNIADIKITPIKRTEEEILALLNMNKVNHFGIERN